MAKRSVLVDIHEKGLDPKKAHSATDTTGRLRPANEGKAPVKAAPKPAPKPAPPVVKEDPVVEEKKPEPKKDSEPAKKSGKKATKKVD
jgi:outer membrane biosynthesis protein TonB